MWAKHWLLLGILALSGCGPQEVVDVKEQEYADVSYSVEGARLVINSNLIFQDDKKTLNDQAVKVLRSLYNQVNKEYFSRVVIVAHSDNALTEKSALEITGHQAEVVAGYFWFRGVDAGEVEAIGRGFSQPVADMRTVDGIYTNQRIEIFLT